MTHRERFVFPLVLIGLSTLFALGIAEVVLRIMGLGFGHSPLIPDPIFHHVHPRDYRFRLDTPVTPEIVDHDICYDGNGEVADPAAPMHVPRSPKYRVAFVGDSFVEANMVLWREGFAGRLTQLAGDTTYVRNFGVSSYSPIIYRLLWQHQLGEFHPTHVFLLLCSNDIRDDRRYGAIARRDAAGNVIGVPGPSNTLILRLIRHSYVIRFFEMMRLKIEWAIAHRGRKLRVVGGEVEENPEISPETSKYMLDLARDVKASGAQLVLMVVPSKYRLVNHVTSSTEPEFSDRWHAWAAQNGVTFLDLSGPFRSANRPLFFVHDSHFNANGHAVTAEVIRAHYPELFPGRSPL